MIIKILGSLLIFGASVFLGRIYSLKYSKRPEQLREFQVLLNILKGEMQFMANYLKDAFEKVHELSKSEVGNFFLDAAKFLRENPSLDGNRAWNYAVLNNIQNTSLDQEDREILISFGKSLGNSDLDGQIRNIDLTLQYLKVQEEKAEEKRIKNETMYKNLGILGGLCVVILLF